MCTQKQQMEIKNNFYFYLSGDEIMTLISKARTLPGISVSEVKRQKRSKRKKEQKDKFKRQYQYERLNRKTELKTKKIKTKESKKQS